MFTPFSGLLFDRARVADPAAATSPPYDVIGPEEHRELLAVSPFNVVRLLLADGGGGGDASYQRAGHLLREWLSAGALVRDGTPRFYRYEMDFPAATGRGRAVGVLGALQLLPLGDRVIPHEETMDKIRSDRLDMMRATRANVDPIVCLSSSPSLAALLQGDGEDRLDFEAGGVRHRLRDLTDVHTVAAVTESVAAHSVAIADGHHRYTTALRYAAERSAADGAGPWNAILTFMTPAVGGGMEIAPTHRGFAAARVDRVAVESAFECREDAATPPEAPGEVTLVPGRDAGGPPLRLVPRPERLAALPGPWRQAGAAVARELLYPALGVTESDALYFPTTEETLAYLDRHGGGAAVLVAPVTERAVAEAGAEGLRFPQKTTYFRPKPRAGLVLRSLA